MPVCGCGCGEEFEAKTRRGHPQKFASGHRANFWKRVNEVGASKENPLIAVKCIACGTWHAREAEPQTESDYICRRCAALALPNGASMPEVAASGI